MVEHCPSRVLTTSVGFDEHGFNELEYARTVAHASRRGVVEKIVQPDIVDLLPKLAWHFDEPFADSSAVPTYYVSKAARERVTVALSGDGGDELWAGYARHRVEQWEGDGASLAGSGGGPRGRTARRGPPARASKARDRCAIWRCRPPTRARASTPMACSTARRASALYSRDFAAECSRRRSVRRFPRGVRGVLVERSARPRAVRRREDVPGRRHPDQGRQDEHGRVARSARAAARSQAPRIRGDRADAAQAEERPEQVSAAAAARAAAAGMRSSIARSTGSTRRSAAGCAVRWRRWWTACCSTGGSSERGIFDDRSVARLWREHRDGASDHRHRLWSLVMLELWFRAVRRRIGTRRPSAGDSGSGSVVMCGIAGLVAVDGLDRDAPARARRMRDVITHRGPDEAGLHCDEHAALAHRRLSIVDLSTGQQPLSNEDGSDLGRLQRRNLQPRGRSGASSKRAAINTARSRTPRRSSTRYEEWGDDCVQRLPRHVCVRALGRAEAAAAAGSRSSWHQAAVLGARGRHAALRIGDQGAARERSDSTPEPNTAALPELLSTRYLSGAETMFRGVHKLLPGHRLIFEHGKTTIQQYWDVPGRAEALRHDRERRSAGLQTAVIRTSSDSSAICSKNRCACG